MTLAVALMDAHPAATPQGSAAWGSWVVHPWTDPTALATDPQVLSPATRQVLVLAPSAGRLRAQIAGSTVAAVRPDLGVRVLGVPTSTAVLTRLLELVPGSATSGNAVFSAVSRLLDSVTWGAWLPSVAKLESPTPTLRQHVQSWFPDSNGFLAVRGEPGWVARLPLSQVPPERRLPRVPAPGVPADSYECHAFGELPEPAIETLFAMGLTTRPVRRERVGDVAATWGSPKAVEFVVSWPSMADLHPAPGRCASCGDPVWGPACAFCRRVPEPVRHAAEPVRGIAS